MGIDTFWQDLRIGMRVLLKEKGFCFLAVAILALGIGGVTTQFTVINATVLRGFSFPNAERLVDLSIGTPANIQRGFTGLDPNDYAETAAQHDIFEQSAGYIQGATMNTVVSKSPQRYQGAYVTEDFFRVLGMKPAMGRDFSAADNRPGAPKVVIISGEFWQRDFDGDPEVVGRTMRLNGRPATVIGVMPPGFKFPVSEVLWTPLYNEFPLLSRNDLKTVPVNALARLKAGVSIDQANVTVGAMAKRLALEHPDTNKTLTAGLVQPLLNNFIGQQLRAILYGMLAAVAVVLLIACVNVMNMQFARATLRAKELAIRGALGATRGRLIRQMLTESLLLGMMGAVAGTFLAEWWVVLLGRATASLTFPLPYWVRFTIDVPVLLFTIGVAVLSAVLSGLIPAILISRANSASVMKEAGRGNSSRLVNVLIRGLVIFQIALTSALLIICCMQVKSVGRLGHRHFGYDEDRYLTARLGLFDADYPTQEARNRFFTQVLRELRADPQIASAALTQRFRMTFGGFGQYEVDGKAYVDTTDRPQANFDNVSEGYFEAMKIPLLEGRSFNADDTDMKQPVAIVNQSFARKYWGNASPLGHQVRFFAPGTATQWRTVIGVVPDFEMQAFAIQGGGQFIPEGFFVPFAAPLAPQFATVVVEPRAGKAESLLATMQADLNRVDSNLPLYFIGTPHHLHEETLAQQRIIATLFAIFGAFAILLSAVGLYGVMSFSVNQRTLEFGIRMALGADPVDILRMVMRQGGAQLGIGLFLGVGAAATLLLLASATTLNQFFPFVSPRDPIIYGGVCGLISAVATVACLMPAQRATRVHPMVALRSE